MDKFFIIWESDAWLSKNNRVLMGIYDSLEKAIDSILTEMSKQNAFEKSGPNREDTRRMLENLHQTQGFDTNYLIDTVSLNKWEEI